MTLHYDTNKWSLHGEFIFDYKRDGDFFWENNHLKECFFFVFVFTKGLENKEIKNREI